jgi:hypothetical protein
VMPFFSFFVAIFTHHDAFFWQQKYPFNIGVNNHSIHHISEVKELLRYADYFAIFSAIQPRF